VVIQGCHVLVTVLPGYVLQLAFVLNLTVLELTQDSKLERVDDGGWLIGNH
jgi:hypothetical protein